MGRGALTVAALAALSLPLAACATITPASPLVHAGCPTEIRIQTDDLPGAPWGFLYALLDRDAVGIRFVGREVSAPLVIDGEDTGVRLTILSGDRSDGRSADVELHEDPTLLLAAVDTDVALLDVVRYPTVGLFSPLARDTRLVYWNPEIYPGVRSIEGLGDTLTADGLELVPITGVPDDPFRDYMVGIGGLGADQVTPSRLPSTESYLAGGGVAAQFGDLLVDPYLLGLREDATPVESQMIDDSTYSRDTLLSAPPQSVVRHADCFRELIPVLQQSLVDYLREPQTTNDLMAEVAARFGHPERDAAFMAAAHDTLVDGRLVSNGRDDAIGDVDFGRVRDLLSAMSSAWRRLEVDFPSVTVEDIVTNEFIDRTIGL